MDRHLKEIVYTPDSELRQFGRLLRHMGEDLRASRELAWRLFVRNVSAQYRQSLFGYAWAFVPPVFTALIWIFLASQRVFTIGETGIPYVVFVITGTVFWQTFVDALNAPLQMVSESKSMLAKINFPREALILAGIGLVLFNFLIRALLLIAVMWWYRMPAQFGILLVPVGVLSLIGFGTMVGVLLTPLGVLYQDVGRGLTVLTQAWFFLTPVIYPTPQASFAATMIEMNPVTPLVVSTRDWLITGQASLLDGFLWVSGFTLSLLFAGWVLYRIAMPHLISRMSA
jgi:lipopolysaccharide transport system permease protein